MSEITRKDAKGFMECGECAAKPGTPLLCQACLNNRSVLHQQAAEIERLRAKLGEREAAAKACWQAVDWDDTHLENNRIQLLAQWPWLTEEE